MQALQTMTSDIDDQNNTDILNDLNDICDECKNKDESVSQNLILTGFKLCKSCRVSKTIFPIKLIWLTGSILILLITKDIDNNAMIKKDKKTIPKDLKVDFKFNICFFDIIKPAKIKN